MTQLNFLRRIFRIFNTWCLSISWFIAISHETIVIYWMSIMLHRKLDLISWFIMTIDHNMNLPIISFGNAQMPIRYKFMWHTCYMFMLNELRSSKSSIETHLSYRFIVYSFSISILSICRFRLVLTLHSYTNQCEWNFAIKKLFRLVSNALTNVVCVRDCFWFFFAIYLYTKWSPAHRQKNQHLSASYTI